MNEVEFNLKDNSDVMYIAMNTNSPDSSQLDMDGLRNHIECILKHAELTKDPILIERLGVSLDDRLVLEDISFVYTLRSTDDGWKPSELYKKSKKGNQMSYKICERY